MQKPTDKPAAQPDTSARDAAGGDQHGPREIVTVAGSETDKQPDAARGKRQDASEEDWQRRHSKWSLWINGAIGFFAIAGFAALCYQIDSTAEDAAGTNAAVAKALQHAEQSSAAVERAVTLFERMTAQRERPWVVFKGIQHSGGAGSVVFRNVGPLPAAQLRGEIMYAFLPMDATFPENPREQKSELIAHGRGSTVAFVGAGEEYGFPVRFPAGFHNLEGRQTLFYIYGTVGYEDQSKAAHTTRFCAFLYDSRWNGCGTHNSAN